MLSGGEGLVAIFSSIFFLTVLSSIIILLIVGTRRTY